MRVEVTTPSGIGRAAETVTSADGAASLTYMTDAARDGEGVYAIDALASRDGYDSLLASATFEVTGGTAEAGRRTQSDVSEAEIASHWKEEESIHPSPEFVAQANLTDRSAFDRFGLDGFPECFREYADLLTWDKYWHTTLDSSNPPFWKWWVGGKLNASYNCVDRHLAKHRNKAAFIWVSEQEDENDQVVTYQDLYVRVNEFASLLRESAGVKAGDRVTFHMPMLPAGTGSSTPAATSS